MIGVGIAKTLLSGAAGMVAAIGQVTRHVVWYLRYQVDGTAHERDADEDS